MTASTRRRILTVCLAPVAALAAWALMRLLGIDFVVSVGDGVVGPGDVITAALVGALAGWVALRLVERHCRYPRPWWCALGSTALSVSGIGPSYFAADGPTALALFALHFAVAIVVIPGFASTLPVRKDGRAHNLRRPRKDPV